MTQTANAIWEMFDDVKMDADRATFLVCSNCLHMFQDWTILSLCSSDFILSLLMPCHMISEFSIVGEALRPKANISIYIYYKRAWRQMEMLEVYF